MKKQLKCVCGLFWLIVLGDTVHDGGAGPRPGIGGGWSQSLHNQEADNGEYECSVCVFLCTQFPSLFHKVKLLIFRMGLFTSTNPI